MWAHIFEFLLVYLCVITLDVEFLLVEQVVALSNSSVNVVFELLGDSWDSEMWFSQVILNLSN